MVTSTSCRNSVSGLLLAETEFRHEVEVTIEPFKGLLLGLFFVSIGIGLNVPLLLQKPAEILGGAAGLLAVNAAVIFGLARLFRLSWRAAAEAALLLAGAGEFAFVILGQAMDQKLVGHETGEAVLVAATLSMTCIPLLAALGARVGGRRIAQTEFVYIFNYRFYGVGIFTLFQQLPVRPGFQYL